MEAFVIGLIIIFTACVSKINKITHKKQIQLQNKINYEFSIFDSFVTRTREVLKTNSAYCDQICCNQEEIDTLKAEIDEYLKRS